MKGFIILSISAAVLLLVGWQTVDHTTSPAPLPSPEPEIITSVEGTWYSFPGGLVVQFDSDGRADFGVNTDGTPYGYSAETWFEGDKLSIKFSNYDGEIDLCRESTGVYQVQQLDGGIIRFVTIADECQFRADTLSGHAELGFELAFHPASF